MLKRLGFNLVRLSFAVVVGAAVGFSPVTWAQESTGDNKIDLQNLVFYKGDAYSVTYEDTVSREATNTTTIRKIGYGQTSIVSVITTTSGVYSSDAMTNPHFRYPGIHVEQVPVEDEDGHHYHPRLAGSFVSIVRTPSALIIQGNRANCVITKVMLKC